MKRTEIQELLPSVFRRTVRHGNPLAGLLEVMEALHEPSEQILADIDAYFDAYRTSDRFIPYLAVWVDLDWVLGGSEQTWPSPETAMPSGIGLLRELVAHAAFLSGWRGTAKGLITFLETATGVVGFQIDETPKTETGQIIPFHIRVLVPTEAQGYVPMIRRIVESQKPAHVTYELG